MTKKHFEAIAAILSGAEFSIVSGGDFAYEELVEKFAAYLGQENPRFDKEKFFNACGV